MRTPTPLAPILLVFLGFIIIPKALAQTTSCAQTIRLATSIYEQGRLHELPDLLAGCLKGGFTKQEKVTAYKLLTLSYIYLEEPEKADESMLNLLQTDNYFEINEAVDPAEFVALYRTFRTTAIYRFGGKSGVVVSQPNVTAGSKITEGESHYEQGYGFAVGASGEFPISSRIILNPEIYFQVNNSGYSNIFHTDIGDFTTTAAQRLTYISLPLAVQYNLYDGIKRKSKLNPYLSVGIAVDYLASATLRAEKKRTGYQAVEAATFVVTPQRQKLNISPIVGAGIKVKAAGGFAIAEIRYRYGVTAVTNTETQFDDPDLVFNYHYVDSIFKLNALSFTLGYVHNIFSPKKNLRK
jgi:Outer membrane protein beta-barrel domain